MLIAQQALQKLTTAKPAYHAYSASDTYKERQRQQRERGYIRRALRANMQVWSLVVRFLRALHDVLDIVQDAARRNATTTPTTSDTEWNAFPLYPNVNKMTSRAFDSGGYIVYSQEA